jgi:hypothetical protein
MVAKAATADRRNANRARADDLMLTAKKIGRRGECGVWEEGKRKAWK